VRFRDLEELKAAQLADAESQARAEDADLRSSLWRRLGRWARRAGKAAKLVKAAVEIVGGIAALIAFAWKAYGFYKARDGSPELPATGVASTAIDRVDKSSPPKP
jgi:hypothetical protein